MVNIEHASGGDKGIWGQGFLSQLELWEKVKRREAGHLIPAPRSVMRKWTGRSNGGRSEDLLETGGSESRWKEKGRTGEGGGV